MNTKRQLENWRQIQLLHNYLYSLANCYIHTRINVHFCCIHSLSLRTEKTLISRLWFCESWSIPMIDKLNINQWRIWSTSDAGIHQTESRLCFGKLCANIEKNVAVSRNCNYRTENIYYICVNSILWSITRDNVTHKTQLRILRKSMQNIYTIVNAYSIIAHMNTVLLLYGGHPVLAAQEISPNTPWKDYLLRNVWVDWLVVIYQTIQVKNFANVKSIQNCCFFFLFPASGVLENRKHDVSETDPISETSCFLFPRTLDDGKVKKQQFWMLYTSSEPFRIYL
jgi:hypothetical protein